MLNIDVKSFKWKWAYIEENERTFDNTMCLATMVDQFKWRQQMETSKGISYNLEVGENICGKQCGWERRGGGGWDINFYIFSWIMHNEYHGHLVSMTNCEATSWHMWGATCHIKLSFSPRAFLLNARRWSTEMQERDGGIDARIIGCDQKNEELHERHGQKIQ